VPSYHECHMDRINHARANNIHALSIQTCNGSCSYSLRCP
jgi:hypothetical protein